MFASLTKSIQRDWELPQIEHNFLGCFSKRKTLEATRCCLSQNVPHENLCSISSNPSLIPISGFCGHFSVTGIPTEIIHHEMNSLPMLKVNYHKLPFLNTCPWCKDNFFFTKWTTTGTYSKVTSSKINFTHDLSIPHNTPCYPQKFCFSFSWDYCYNQEELKAKVMQRYGGQPRYLTGNAQVAIDEIWMLLNELFNLWRLILTTVKPVLRTQWRKLWDTVVCVCLTWLLEKSPFNLSRTSTFTCLAGNFVS